MPARSEPLLWVQLLGAGVLPLEGLLLLLLLAGSDPGPVPGLERLLCWGLGALAPTLLLWRRPADVWSLLLLQTPLRARRPLQQRLSRLQDNLGLRLGLALAGAISLPLLWWLDEHAAVASSLSPLAGSPRLVVLLLAALLLVLMLWQWQQLLQALWLLSRSPEAVASARPLPQQELEEQRLCLGLPLLLLEPLQLAVPAGAATSGATNPQPAAVAPKPTESLRSAVPADAAPTDAAPAAPSVAATSAAAPEPLPQPDSLEGQGQPGPQPAAGTDPASSQTVSAAVVDSDAVSGAAEPLEPPADDVGGAAPDPTPSSDPAQPELSPALISPEPADAIGAPGAISVAEAGDADPTGDDTPGLELVAPGPEIALEESDASAQPSQDLVDAAPDPGPEADPDAAPAPTPEAEQQAAQDTAAAEVLTGSETTAAGEPQQAPEPAAGSGDGVSVAVEPEQASEQGQGGHLNQQIG